MKDDRRLPCHPLDILCKPGCCLEYHPVVIAVDIDSGGAGGRYYGKCPGFGVVQHEWLHEWLYVLLRIGMLEGEKG